MSVYLSVKLLYVEDNIATVSVDGVIEKYEIQIGGENFIEINDGEGETVKYTIGELSSL